MLPSRLFHHKPDFDECIARIYAWYEQAIVDRPPVRFHHHNVEYERHRTVPGPWRTAEERWLDVDFQVQTFVASLKGATLLGETFPVFWPNLSAVVYNLFLGQAAKFDDVTAWTHPCIDDIDDLPDLKVQREGTYFRAVEALANRALELAEGQFLVGYTDMYAGIDCTLGRRGAEQMCLDLVTHPEQIKRLIDLAFAEYGQVYRHFDETLKAHDQLSVTWMNLPVPKLTDWGPNSVGMVAVIVAMGAVIATVAAKGYDAVAHFANIAAPWMVVMFLVFGIAALPELGVTSFSDFWRVANEVWDGKAAEGHIHFTFWHVICFAWFGNMAWHLGMGDLTIFRYARKARYGLASAAGMYLGHYIAWISAGLLYAVQVKHNPADTSVVPGPLAFRVAGFAGILLVLVAGWTTANPVIYRAGLAFQSIRPKWSRVRVTLVAGAIASVIAIFPGLCNKFLSVAMLYGLVLMPMGAVIFADHYLMKKLGMVEFYAERTGRRLHWPPVLAWGTSLLICFALWYYLGIQEFFLSLPGWLLAGVIYLIASKLTQSPAALGEDS